MAKNLENMSADELRADIYKACKILERLRADYDGGHAEMGDIVTMAEQISKQVTAAGITLPRLYEAGSSIKLMEHEFLMTRIKAGFACKDIDAMDGFQLAEAAKGEIEQAKELRRRLASPPQG